MLELQSDTVQLPPGVRLIEIAVARGEAGDFDPAEAAARVGDVVRFTARDRQSHAVAFEGALLTSQAIDFLERTGQLRGPPLLEEGASWIVSLDGAPAGGYPFRCLTHGRTGRLTVSASR